MELRDRIARVLLISGGYSERLIGQLFDDEQTRFGAQVLDGGTAKRRRRDRGSGADYGAVLRSRHHDQRPALGDGVGRTKRRRHEHTRT
jgi:hypothetical protein